MSYFLCLSITESCLIKCPKYYLTTFKAHLGWDIMENHCMLFPVRRTYSTTNHPALLYLSHIAWKTREDKKSSIVGYKVYFHFNLRNYIGAQIFVLYVFTEQRYVFSFKLDFNATESSSCYPPNICCSTEGCETRVCGLPHCAGALIYSYVQGITIA